MDKIQLNTGCWSLPLSDVEWLFPEYLDLLLEFAVNELLFITSLC